jgi:hypothetical protein
MTRTHLSLALVAAVAAVQLADVDEIYAAKFGAVAIGTLFMHSKCQPIGGRGWSNNQDTAASNALRYCRGGRLAKEKQGGNGGGPCGGVEATSEPTCLAVAAGIDSSTHKCLLVQPEKSESRQNELTARAEALSKCKNGLGRDTCVVFASICPGQMH